MKNNRNKFIPLKSDRFLQKPKMSVKSEYDTNNSYREYKSSRNDNRKDDFIKISHYSMNPERGIPSKLNYIDIGPG